MNIFFLSMNPRRCARMHANIHIVKMIVETAQLLCNVHRRQRELCLAPYIGPNKIPYKESASGHRKLGSMIWVGESHGNYKWAVQLGLELCAEYNQGRGRAAGKTTQHRTQRVLEWLQRYEPNFKIKRRTPVKLKHLAMPDKFKKASSSIEAYRDYYYSKRKTMTMAWDPKKRTPDWWEARRMKKAQKRVAPKDMSATPVKKVKKAVVADTPEKKEAHDPSVQATVFGADSSIGDSSAASQSESKRLKRKTSI